MKQITTQRLVAGIIALGFQLAFGSQEPWQQEPWERLTEYEKPKNAAEQQAWDLIKASRHQGSEGARRLIAEMPRIPHKYRKNALGVLSRTQCQEARDYLLSLALSASDTYAAIVYMENSGDPAAPRNLLNSTNRAIQAIALQGLLSARTKWLTERREDYSIPLDRRAWAVVNEMLAAESLEHRMLATRVTSAASSSEVPVAEKAQVLAESMRTTLLSPEAPKASGDGSFVYSYSCPLGERALVEQALALGGLGRGDSNGVIRELVAALTPAEPELVREGMVIARFLAGDHTLRGEVHRIATNSPSGRLRMAVLEQALNFRTVTEADRECLERVAAADPLEGRPGSEYVFQTGDRSFEELKDWSKAKIYPARILAQWSLRVLDARTNPPPTGP